MPMVVQEIREGVAELTLNRPEIMNALADGVLDQLSRAFDDALSNPDVGSILLTGAGKGFCAGANLEGEALLQFGAGVTRHIEEDLNPLLNSIKTSPKPVICALNGAAAGAGAGLALACDIVLAAKSARIILSFVRIGAVLDGGTSHVVQSLAGASRARAMSLLGEPVDAETALDFGLVWKICDDDKLLTEARQMARGFARGPQGAYGLIKQELLAAQTQPYEQSLTLEARLQGEAFCSPELQEGVRAFQQKRSADFVASRSNGPQPDRP